jgi:Ca2+-binding EF-hand superfamily protein
MTQEEKDLMIDTKKLLHNCKELEREMKATKEGVDFLINEYKTNKRYFRAEPGKVTIEDVIKTCFEFGWASKRIFDYDTRR